MCKCVEKCHSFNKMKMNAQASFLTLQQITGFFILSETSKTLIVFCENKILSFFPMMEKNLGLK